MKCDNCGAVVPKLWTLPGKFVPCCNNPSCPGKVYLDEKRVCEDCYAPAEQAGNEEKHDEDAVGE